ncbi:hypothetical protein [Ferruginibacter albus]|uniref:hypothetical protein n=1 Tax=Ferruginibacter albus TaxID=2875540 RepID=UPI001CC3D4C1|nr:hypothetical protein [Ferruginibacter albus]UAY50778.1 hypothetical protein K9M53_09255 [Ferruginibacter albus]
MEFSPVIDQLLFGEIIVSTQDREGNSSRRFISTVIDGYEDADVFDVFMNACEKNNIVIKYLEEEQEEQKLYKVLITVNNRDYSSFSYASPEKDISKLLADELYSILAKELKNKLLIEEVKTIASTGFDPAKAKK